MISQKSIDQMRQSEGVDWISALKTDSIN